MVQRVILFVIILAALGFDISHTRVSEDLRLFFPAPETTQQRLALSLLDLEADSNTLVVAISGAPAAELVAENRKLANKLRSTGLFSAVVNGVSAAMIGPDDPLFAYRYHLARPGLGQRLSLPGLKQALQDRVAELQSPAAPIMRDLIPRDPTGEWMRILAAMQPANAPETESGVWVSRDRLRSLMLLRFASSVTSSVERQSAIERIRYLHRTLGLATRLEVNGAPVLALKARRLIQHDARLLSIVGTLLVLVFLRLSLGSWRQTLMLGLPLLAGVILALSGVILVFGKIHGITIAFGVTLLGVAIDYPVHAFLHRGMKESVWPTLSLGLISTVIAFGSLTLSGIEGLRQLGVFAATGLLMAAAFTRWLLPGIIGSEAPENSAEWLHRCFSGLFQGLVKWRFALYLPVVAALIFIAVKGVPMDLDFARLNPLPAQQGASYAKLAEDLKAPDPVRFMAVVAASQEAALQAEERLLPSVTEAVRQSWLGGRIAAADFLPSVSVQDARLKEIPAPGKLRKNLHQALVDSPFKPGVFAPFLKDIESAPGLPVLTLAQTAGSLVGERVRPLMLTMGDRVAGLIQLIPPLDDTALSALAEANPGLWFVNLRQTTAALLEQAIHRGILLLLGGVVLIHALVTWRLGLKFASMVVAAPLSAMVLLLALGGLAGITLNLFHLVSLLLVFGLGLDYALFFHYSAHSPAPRQTFKSLWISAVTTIMVFGVLAISATPALRAIGLTVSFGAFFSLILAAAGRAGLHKP